MKDIENELKELREKQEMGKATLEQSLNDNAFYLQEQVSKKNWEQLRLCAVAFLVGWSHGSPQLFCCSGFI